jgi:hypothetical protein
VLDGFVARQLAFGKGPVVATRTVDDGNFPAATGQMTKDDPPCGLHDILLGDNGSFRCCRSTHAHDATVVHSKLRGYPITLPTYPAAVVPMPKNGPGTGRVASECARPGGGAYKHRGGMAA